MRRVASIWLRVIVAVNFLTGAIGIPLYAHVCASMGTRALISSCMMHEDAFVPVPEPVVVDEPVVSSCCSEEAADGTASVEAATSVTGDAADVSHDPVQTGDCCTDEDVTMQVTDSFTAVHDGHGMLPLGSAGVLAQRCCHQSRCSDRSRRISTVLRIAMSTMEKMTGKKTRMWYRGMAMGIGEQTNLPIT